jgi:hypothetical protein
VAFRAGPILDATWRRLHPTPQKLGAHNER